MPDKRTKKSHYASCARLLAGMGLTLAAALYPLPQTGFSPADNLPVTRAAYANQTPAVYTVKPGDTLWGISRRYGTTVAALKAVNGLKGDLIFPGQVLRLPGTASPAPRPPVDQPSRAGDRIQEMLRYAESLLGVPYRWAGNTPSGFDCSGYVQHVYGRFGINLPHASYAQFTCGTPAEREALRPGDLVFFSTYGPGATHVGIYYSNGRFLHASSAAGRVCWQSLGDAYYKARYIGARRIIPASPPEQPAPQSEPAGS
ncbi:MAG: C40 family peptidase [Desulfotomaculales bacterium]